MGFLLIRRLCALQAAWFSGITQVKKEMSPLYRNLRQTQCNGWNTFVNLFVELNCGSTMTVEILCDFLSHDEPDSACNRWHIAARTNKMIQDLNDYRQVDHIKNNALILVYTNAKRVQVLNLGGPAITVTFWVMRLFVLQLWHCLWVAEVNHGEKRFNSLSAVSVH